MNIRVFRFVVDIFMDNLWIRYQQPMDNFFHELVASLATCPKLTDRKIAMGVKAGICFRRVCHGNLFVRLSVASSVFRPIVIPQLMLNPDQKRAWIPVYTVMTSDIEALTRH